MRNPTPTPRQAIARGLIAGAAGTAAMTAAQTIYYKATETEGSTTPAEVGKRIIRGVLQRSVDDERTGLLNNVMHWAYGTGWGALLGIEQGSDPRPTISAGLGFGAAVWAWSLIELPAMQLAPPIWKTPPSSIAPDLGFHLVYGLGAGAAYRLLDGPR